MRSTSLLLAWTLGVLAIHGCSSNEGTPTPSPPPSDAGASIVDASDSGSLPRVDANVAEPACVLGEKERSRLTGTLRHLDGSASPPAIAGARVCVHGRTDLPCATTDAAGKYDHACLPAGEFLVHFSLAGYPSVLWARTSAAGESHELDTFLVHDSENQALFATATITYPRAGYGMITINDKTTVDGTKMAAVTANVEGPFYSADAVTIDTNATATAGQRLAFFVAPVGEVEVKVTSAGGAACRQLGFGFQGSDSGIVKLPVLEGTETAVFVVCP